MLASSLLELLAAIPSHLIVTRRPGCFVGILTMTGIIAGVYVMLWSFGPGIILLFLREKRKAEAKDVKESAVGEATEPQKTVES